MIMNLSVIKNKIYSYSQEIFGVNENIPDLVESFDFTIRFSYFNLKEEDWWDRAHKAKENRS